MASMRVRETLRMARGEVRRVIAGPGTAIRVQRGRVWLTEQGGGKDWHVADGQAHAVAACGVTVLESLSPALVDVLEPVPLRALVAATLSRAMRRISRRVTRAGACPRTDNPA